MQLTPQEIKDICVYLSKKGWKEKEIEEFLDEFFRQKRKEKEKPPH